MLVEPTKIKIGAIDAVPGFDPYHVNDGSCDPTRTVLKIRHNDRGVPLVYVEQDFGSGRPPDEAHDLTLTADLFGDNPCRLPDATALRGYLEAEAGQLLLSRIVEGHETYWDDHNYVGRLTDDGSSAFDELLAGIGDLPHHEWILWLVEEWLGDVALGIHADTTSEQLEQVIAEMEAEAQSEHIVLSGDIRDFLTTYRNQKLADEE